MREGDSTLDRRGFVRRLAAVALAAGGARGPLLTAGGVAAAPRHHPDPRPGITASRVLTEAELPADDAESRRAFAIARERPALLDGLACVCSCVDSARHRSLLACYETSHPTSCPGCLDEAALAGRLAAEGRDLDEVRRAVDEAFGR
jgi:hypothetical protein